MDLVNRISQFSTDERCRELLKRLRWPNSPECPRCFGKAVELETEKVNFVVESEVKGSIVKIMQHAGEVVAVGGVLGIIEAE